MVVTRRSPAHDGPGSEPRRCLVARDGSWIRGAPGVLHRLRMSSPQRRVLAALAEARARGTEPTSADALFAAAWPGEKGRASAIANRLRVAIHGLRRSGLARQIFHGPGGYRLARGVVIVAAQPEIDPGDVGDGE